MGRETPFGQKQLLKTSKKPDTAPGGCLGHVERLAKVRDGDRERRARYNRRRGEGKRC